MTARSGEPGGAGDSDQIGGQPGGAGRPGRRGTAVPVVNIANALTVSRLLLIPVFVAALFADGGEHTGWRLVATAVFVAASVTDRFDGDLARRRGLITDFGRIADPIADKALTGAALIGLSTLGLLPWWVTVTILAREAGVTLLRFWVRRHGAIPSSRGGKTKTFTQAVAIGVYLLPLPDWLDPLRWTVMAVALVMTMVTGLDYVVRALRLRAASRRAAAGEGAREEP